MSEASSITLTNCHHSWYYFL